jgi:hypothetical protein
MDKMTSPEDFADMTPREVRDFIREAREQFRSEKSRRHMARQQNFDLLIRQHHAAMQALRAML